MYKFFSCDYVKKVRIQTKLRLQALQASGLTSLDPIHYTG